MTSTDKRQLYFFAIYFVLYEMTCYLSNDMIMPAMVNVVKEFSAPLSSIALSLSYFIIGGSTLQIILGPIADIIGKRKVMLFGNFLFLLATLFIPFSVNISQFLAARFFQGMGMCFIFIGYAMIHEYFDDAGAVRLTSILSNIAIFAPLIGPVLGSGISSISSWKYIFIISGILGIISLIGLFKFMPKDKIINKQFSLAKVAKSYKNIFTCKIFMFGIFINGIASIPIIAWIGLSPTIILEKMHKSFTLYIVYQVVMFTGFIVSSSYIQKIAGRVSFKAILKNSGIVSIVGILIAAIFNHIGVIFISGMFIYAFGFGLCNGAIYRIAFMSTGESSSLSSAALGLINCLYLSIGLEVYNIICNMFNYSLFSYAMLNIPIGIVVFLCAFKFAKINEERKWESHTVV